jgi:hypothetical protein
LKQSQNKIFVEKAKDLDNKSLSTLRRSMAESRGTGMNCRSVSTTENFREKTTELGNIKIGLVVCID